MNANNDNNNGGENGERHEIPADHSASDNEEVVDNDRHDSHRDDDTCQERGGNDVSGNGDGQGERDVNNNGDGTEADEREGCDPINDDKGNQRSEENYDEGNLRSAYTSNMPQQQLYDPNHMVYPTNGGPQFFPSPFDPNCPSNLPFSYNPLPPQQALVPQHGLPPNLAPNLPPMLPPPPSMHMPPPSALATNNPNNSGNLDATRQYYEARMREHAMQYANAAAGAAWAAARIACGGDSHLGFLANHPPPHHPPPPSSVPSSYYTPASAPHPMMGHPSPINSNDVKNLGPRQKRTLWNPPSSPEDKSSSQGRSSSKIPKKGGAAKTNARQNSTATPTAATGASPRSSGPQAGLLDNGKKRSKKRESRGNDSVSSLGSESRDHRSVGGGGIGGGKDNKCKNSGGGNKRSSGKKGNQRRRFNEDAAASPGNNTASNTNGHGKQNEPNNNNNGNLRQKRGLHHGHSSKSSFSSFGSGNNPHPSSSGRNKKKNRSQSETSSSLPTNSSIHLGGLIGKNGARALHELCSKYRWEMPKYNSIESQLNHPSAAGSPDTGNKDGNGSNNNDISFVLTVNVNGVELGRGRGGTKVAAKQDASRKALAALVPGVVFDPNGILLDVGSGGSEHLLCGGSKNNADRAGRGSAAGVGIENAGGTKPLSLDELGPHLASQLAIGGNNNHNNRPQSPDHSEDSSISTAISEELTLGGPLILGGPLSQKRGLQQPSPGGAAGNRFFSSNIYPCASTTSGVSSASDIDEEDENAYYSSRGASVCSTLLHAMWQIDDRIREPPSYVFDLCPSPMNMKGQVKQNSDVAAAVLEGATCSKRKKVESPREVATVRMFQCIASLNLYFPKHLMGNNNDSSSLMDYWESPLDHLQSKEASPSAEKRGIESSQSRKRKDSFASQSTPSPNRPQQHQIDSVDEPLESPKSLQKQEKEKQEKEEEEFIQHKLESTGTGSTKRESKHKASAKLLATLFPGCKSMLEVKAEAEAARELYAANKAESQTKRAKLTTTISSPERKDLSGKRNSALSNTLPSSMCSRPLNQKQDMKPSISLHALSLSEPKEGTKRIKWSASTNIAELEYETNIENEVDAALQSLQDFDEEGRWAARDLSFNDVVGKIILRRANPDDTDYVHTLLNKDEATSTTVMANAKHFSATGESVEAEIDLPASESDNDENGVVDEENVTTDDDNNREVLLGENSILLVLSRAVALYDPPLGCAVLTLKCPSNNDERHLTLCRLGHEKHLPRERFVECLEAFAKILQCDLDTYSGHCASGLAVSSDEIRSFLSRSSPLYQNEDVVDCVKGNASHTHLQSVKEEDSEEVEDGSEGGEESDKKIDTGGSSLAKGKLCKPSKRSRVA